MINYLMKSGVPGMIFPAAPAASNSQLIAALWQLEKTQWLDPQALRQRQSLQFVQMMHHARRYSPFYKKRLQDLGSKKKPLDNDSFLQIPLLTRADIQSHHDALLATKLPPNDAVAGTTETSGSTGQTVKVTKSRVNQLFFQAIGLREHFWHQRDFKGSIAVIRAGIEADKLGRSSSWGKPLSTLFETGPAHLLAINTPVREQVNWLNGIDPDYLMTYPTNLRELLKEAADGRLKLSRLKQVRTIGEPLPEELREQCNQLLGVLIADVYSSQELGNIGDQCPHSGLYHVPETLMVEVLHTDGRPCRAGETGRLVITDLTNFAMPLIRYEIRDYAELGAQCPCGRGLPTLRRILGRQRNMLVLPNGDRYWPLTGFKKFKTIADIRQYQIIQQSLTDVDVHLVVSEPLTPGQQQKLTETIKDALGHPFNLHFTEHSTELPKTIGGKFEEFVCNVN